MIDCGNSKLFSIRSIFWSGNSVDTKNPVGSFNIRVNFRIYGVESDEASILNCSADAVASRILYKGKHTLDRLSLGDNDNEILLVFDASPGIIANQIIVHYNSQTQTVTDYDYCFVSHK